MPYHWASPALQIAIKWVYALTMSGCPSPPPLPLPLPLRPSSTLTQTLPLSTPPSPSTPRYYTYLPLTSTTLIASNLLPHPSDPHLHPPTPTHITPPTPLPLTHTSTHLHPQGGARAGQIHHDRTPLPLPVRTTRPRPTDLEWFRTARTQPHHRLPCYSQMINLSYDVEILLLYVMYCANFRYYLSACRVLFRVRFMNKS